MRSTKRFNKVPSLPGGQAVRAGLRHLARFAEVVAFAHFHRETLERHGLFDPEYYKNTRLNSGLAKYAPLLDYLLIGWREGWAPASTITPESLARRYGYFGTTEPISHLEAYVRVGRFFGFDLRSDEARDNIFASIRPVDWSLRPQSSTAVVVHAFYLPELETILGTLQGDADLIITTPLDPAQVAKRAPEAHIVRLPNHGRDVFPFVHLINCGLLDRYEIIVKLHTKRSPHRSDGGEWLRRAIKPFADIGGVIRRFEGEPQLGMLGAPGMILTTEYLNANYHRIEALAGRLGFRFDPAQLRFAAGTFFAARSSALRPIAQLGLAAADFEAECGQLDGSLAHAMERFFGAAVIWQKYSVDQ